MRVISGTARGLKLSSLDTLDTRPTLDRIKESLFNIIQPNVKDSVILDLFAGSGALGIECASRGAAQITFCDASKEAIKIIHKNIEKARVQEKSIVINMDFLRFLKKNTKKYDIIFIDPPYHTDFVVQACKEIGQTECLDKNGIIIIETDDDKRIFNQLQEVNLPFAVYDQRKYGRVKLIVMRKG